MENQSFATLEDLKAYSLNDKFPDNVAFLLARANELVLFRIEFNVNYDNEKHLLAAKKAVCAQVLFWIETGISPTGYGTPSSFSLGDLSISNGAGAEEGNPTSLCNLSLSYLRREGLTYLGIRNGNRGSQKV